MEPLKAEIKRDEKGRIVPGSAAINPAGRPKGQTLKEFAREMLMSMNPEEKRVYLKQLPPEIVWKMAEGNPHSTSDVMSGNEPIKTVLVQFIDKQEDAKDNTDSI